MAKNLNILYKYPRIKPVKFRTQDIAKLRANPINSSADWDNATFASIKRLLRFVHYKTQKRRCAYCRRMLNPLAINEHIDHLVARFINCKWMFKPKNLVVACYQCNTQKTKSNILHGTIVPKRLPCKHINYRLFNPYYHSWNDHFEIEDSIFIRARSSEGQETINTLKLYDFKYSIIYSQEANIFGSSAIKRATRRLSAFPPGSNEYESANNLITEISRHI